MLKGFRLLGLLERCPGLRIGAFSFLRYDGTGILGPIVAEWLQRRYFAPGMKKKVQAVEKLALDPAPAVRLIAFPGGKK